ncbi:MAG: protein arginine kinase [bacterium]
MTTPSTDRLQDMAVRAPSWMEASEGEEEDIVLSTRLRLARNLAGHPFPQHAERQEQEAVYDHLGSALVGSGLFGEEEAFPLMELDGGTGRLLVERHLISPTLARKEGPRGVFTGEEERLSVMLNEEDHLRLQLVEGGLASTAAWERLSAADEMLGEELRWAWRSDYGYLTACPANVGTGLRVSVMMHLPALVLLDEAEATLRAATQAGMLVRGVYGEGSSVSGNLYQLANQMTLGRSEEDILESVVRVARQVAEHEENARVTLRREAPLQLEDKVHRALGILGTARLLDVRECLNLLSAVRLGVNMYVLSHVEINTLNALMVLTQPSHLDRREGREMDTDEQDVLRAEVVRGRLRPRGGTDTNE